MRVVAAIALLLLCGAVWAHEAPTIAFDRDTALATSQRAIGKPIGDHALVDTERRAVALADFRGKPLVVSLVYTGCNDVCRTATQFLSKAVREARATFGAGRFNVVTIGFHQPFDTPEAMAAFARQNGVRDADWRFLSAGAKTIEALARDLGFTFAANAGGVDHIAQVSIVDAKGVLYRQVYGDAFDARMLVAPLKDLLSGQASEAGLAGVWDKVKLFCTVYDPRTGRYRVNYSLFVEIFAGFTVLAGIAWFLIVERRRTRS